LPNETLRNRKTGELGEVQLVAEVRSVRAGFNLVVGLICDREGVSIFG
jgi:hypothetical protein